MKRVVFQISRGSIEENKTMATWRSRRRSDASFYLNGVIVPLNLYCYGGEKTRDLPIFYKLLLLGVLRSRCKRLLLK